MTHYTPIFRRLACLAAVSAVLAAALFAQDASPAASPAPAAATEGAAPAKGYRYFDVDPGIRMWGLKADAAIGFRWLEQNDSAVWASLGTAYSFPQYYRLPSGALFHANDNPGGFSAADADYQRFNLYWGLGFRQGLHFDPARDRDDLNLLLAYRGWWDSNLYSAGSLLGQSAIPERDRIVIHSLFLDLVYDTVNAKTTHKTKMPDGLRLEASAEWAPTGLSTAPTVGFAQFSGDGHVFVPLYRQSTEQGWNLFGLYFAGHVGVDYILGLGGDSRQGIPLEVSKRFGGYDYMDGLGGMVRGLGDGYDDGTFKAVGNLELRANFPAILDPDLLFGAVVYVDAGAWATPPGATSFHSGGFVMGAGLGLFVELWDMEVAAYTNFLITDTNYKGQYWSPVVFEFGLHF